MNFIVLFLPLFLLSICDQNLGEQHFLYSSLYKNDQKWKTLIDDEKWEFCDKTEAWILEKECKLYREMAHALEAAMVYQQETQKNSALRADSQRLCLLAASPVFRRDASGLLSHDQFAAQMSHAYERLAADYAALRPMGFEAKSGRVMARSRKWTLQQMRSLHDPAGLVRMGSAIAWPNMLECEMVNRLVKALDDAQKEGNAKKLENAMAKLKGLEGILKTNPTLEGLLGWAGKMGRITARMWHYDWYRPKFAENEITTEDQIKEEEMEMSEQNNES